MAIPCRGVLCVMVLALFCRGAYGHGAVTKPIPRRSMIKDGWCPWCVGEKRPSDNPSGVVNRDLIPSSPCMGTSRGDVPYSPQHYSGWPSLVQSAGPYSAGQTFSATILLSSDHNGDAQWSYCPHSLAETEHCFREHPITEWINVAAYWNETNPGEGAHGNDYFPQTVRLPSDMPAGPATLRWLWVCKNTNELFLSCIDVDVVSNDNDASGTTSTLGTSGSPVTTSTTSTRVYPTTTTSVASVTPDATSAPPAAPWNGSNMKMTHYWDCSGQACDSRTLQPWNIDKYISPPGYAPQDPADFPGGAIYGEVMWLTGAASDSLSALFGADDGCCGMDNDVGGCGKCALVQNLDSIHPDWKAVVMKKNRCPPDSNGCDSSEPHFDVAAPGFDNLQYSTANICDKPGTGFETKAQSAVAGNWWSHCPNTAECEHLCNELPASFQKGCKLFASWGWKSGSPSNVNYRTVPCPAEFAAHVASQFGPDGATSHSFTTTSGQTPVPTTTITTITTTEAEFEPAPEPEFEPVTPTPTTFPTPTPTTASTGIDYCRHPSCGCPPFTDALVDWCTEGNSGAYSEFCNEQEYNCDTICGGHWCGPVV